MATSAKSLNFGVIQRRARFLSGLVSNHVPLGYIIQGGYALKDPESFEIIKKSWDLMATGTKTLREIAVILTRDKVIYKGKVHSIKNNTVQRMFRNKFYMGILASDKYPEEIKGQHIPMVTEEQFYKVQAILDGRNVSTPIIPRNNRDNTSFPLRRILRCSKCGTPFTGAWSKGRKSRYGYYFCRSRCTTKSVAIDEIEDNVREFLARMSPSEIGLKLYIRCLLKTYNSKIQKISKIMGVADNELERLKALRQSLVEKNLAGLYSDDIFKEQNSVLEGKIAACENARNQALIDQYNIESIEEFIKEKLSNLALTYKTSTLSQLRCLLGSIFMSGMTWSYPGISNRQISPIYQAILDTSTSHAPFGDHLYTLYPIKKEFLNDSPCGKSACDWFSWYGSPDYVIVDTSSNWDIRHLLADSADYKKGLKNMEKSGIIVPYKTIGNATLYKIVERAGN